MDRCSLLARRRIQLLRMRRLHNYALVLSESLNSYGEGWGEGVVTLQPILYVQGGPAKLYNSQILNNATGKKH